MSVSGNKTIYVLLLDLLEDKALVNKRHNGSDSDSSSLPSLEEDKDHGKKAKDEKKKTAKGVETSRSQKVSLQVIILS